MDEGRNVILLFPGLVEFGNGQDAEGKRERNVKKMFEPRYVWYATNCYSWD